MKKLHLSILGAGLLGMTLATSGITQQSQENFPRQQKSEKSCQEVNWNSKMLEEHPRLIAACQEVVVTNNENWARFHAKFKRVENDGKVTFTVQDRRDRAVEDVTLVPSSGQMAYIDGRPTRFRDLSTSQMISLYVPEGEYGFATQAGVPRAQMATVAPRTAARTEQSSPQRSSRPAVLPATASNLSWFAIAGLLSLFAGLVLTVRRLF